jgi:GNAT superfamily N-acetyltransferase
MSFLSRSKRVAANTANESAVYSEVDSERFGVRVARANVVSENFPRVMDFCSAERIDLLIARCPTSELDTVHKMESAGFSLMDTLVYYGFDLLRGAIPEDSPRALVRKILPEDQAQVERVAAAAFHGYYGHYHADPRLDQGKCDQGYVAWAVRSCTLRNVATEVLIAERENRIVGFATLRLNSKEEGEGVLFGVAPEAQGAGIYRSFMVSGLQWCKQQQVKRMIVSTQVTNVAVQKVWCRLGFEPGYSYYTLHKWFS